MTCARCGQPMSESARFCPTCGERSPALGQPAAPVAAVSVGPPALSVRYAGFWARVGASTIDGLVIFGLSLPPGLIAAFFGLVIVASDDLDWNDEDTLLGLLVGMFFLWVFYAGVLTLIAWLYSALMESSTRQATLGKRALGLRVADLDGRRISFGRATGRHFGKWISQAVLYIGFLMVAWTQRKQGLHDMMAGTLVLRVRQAPPPPPPWA